jgi:hypothetical protein
MNEDLNYYEELMQCEAINDVIEDQRNCNNHEITWDNLRGV